MHLLPLMVSVLPVPNIFFMFCIPCTYFGISLGLLSDAILVYADENPRNYGGQRGFRYLHSLDAGENQKWNAAVEQVLVDLSRTYSSLRIQVL